MFATILQYLAGDQLAAHINSISKKVDKFNFNKMWSIYPNPCMQNACYKIFL